MADALTDILETVRMRGSIFSRASLAAPWGVESGANSRGIFHAVVSGSMHARLAEGGGSFRLDPGDIVLMPFGDNHLLSDEPGRDARPITELTTIDEAGMGHLLVEGSGVRTSLLCGTVEFDQGEAHPVFSMLPSLIRVKDSDGTLSALVQSLITLIVAEVDDGIPGSSAVVARLTDVLVIYVLRDFITQLPADEVGWLGALRDPEIRKALGLMHAQPDRPWTATDLAGEIGMSRSAFFARFKQLVGESPAQYLTRWRIHLATRMLRGGGMSVTAAGRQVGYRTDAAFSNAFVRIMGVRPGAYKRAA